ncbi:MAG: ROK family transcriptional regulator [Microbacteriaceae bacterium]
MTYTDGRPLMGDVLTLFRRHGELSRTDVIEMSGLSRSTVNQRLNALFASNLITPIEGGESTGGRPSSRFVFNRNRGVLLTADIGASGFTVAVCDLAGTPLRTAAGVINVWEGPARVLRAVQDALESMRDDAEVCGIGIGVPGPVELTAGRVVNPPIMTGWDRFDIAGWFAERYSGPVIVENDANARAVAESRTQGVDNLISLKLGTGIGSGLVFNGQIIRGSEGAAGDIGHTRAAPANDTSAPHCRCGNAGCVEAYAGGWAIMRDLAERGIATVHTADVVTLVRQGDFDAVRLVRQAGRVLGDAVAALVSILNPAMIVISGQLAECDEVLLSGVRERVYQRALPLATRNLQIKTSELGELAGVSGLALIAADQIFGTAAVDDLLSTASLAR